ncbi:Signal transduction histidine kinase [Thermoflexibacter ruber]|uniref:histidine kinase n=1 Tax=Thermoflexibacter ruber TaxID=1003 RepID=A0A1I2FEM1_9BACT|nr:Signal transduction histidine kinase [Thermoflexibacter ruber]
MEKVAKYVSTKNHCKKLLLSFLFCTFLLGCTASLLAQNEEVVVLKNETDLLLVGKQLYFWEDIDGKLSIEDILSPTYQAKFQKNTTNVFARPASTKVYWIKLTVQNLSSVQAWIEAGSIALWYIDYYTAEAGSYQLKLQTGFFRPEQNKAYPTNLFWLPLPGSSQPQTVYLRIQSLRTMELPLQVGTLLSLHQNKTKTDYIVGGFVGLILMMFLYNLFLLIATKDRVYIWYVLYLFSTIFIFTFLNQYPLLVYLFPKLRYASQQYIISLQNISYLFAAVFAIDFLNFRRHVPYFRVYLLCLLLVMIGVIPCCNILHIIPFPILSLTNQMLVLVLALSLVSVSLYLWITKKERIAKFYAWGWIFFFSSTFSFIFTINGVIPYHFLSRNATFLGVSLEALMFSLALADRIRQMRKSQLESRLAILQKTLENKKLIEQQNIILEQKVKERTAELQEQKHLFENQSIMLEQMSSLARVGGWELDLISQKSTWSKTTKEIHEVPLDFEPSIEKGLAFFKEGKDREKISQAVQQLIEYGTPYNIELKLITAKGNELWVRLIGRAEFEQGVCKRIYGAIYDIDAMKRAEEKIKSQYDILLKHSEKLAQANATKDKLFSIIGHDLRSPINTLLNLLDVISKGFISVEEFQQLLPKVHQNVKTVHHTLENLLQWSYSQMQGIKSAPKQVELHEIVLENIALFTEAAQNKEIQLIYDVPSDYVVFADENQTRLIIRNLLNNAIKFTKKGGTISVFAKREGNFIVLTIKDTGVGMSEEQVASLFKNNTSFSTYGTSGEKGTGLGLMLCKEMVEQNKGKICVESELGKGSAFIFSLPMP